MEYVEFRKLVHKIYKETDANSSYGYGDHKQVFKIGKDRYGCPKMSDFNPLHWNTTAPKVVTEDEDIIYVSWNVGGMSGGNCWGDDASPYTERESERELVILEVIAEKVCPNISFLAFNKIVRELVITFEYQEDGYYGNYDEYRGKAVSLNKLYEAMKPHFETDGDK